MKRYLYILLVLVIAGSVSLQDAPQKVSFEKLIEHFKENAFGFGAIQTDSISEKSLYKTKDFSVSISKYPIYFSFDTLVVQNPYYSDDFDDWDDNYINFPVSYSVIYEQNLISLFGNGKFVCLRLNDYSRNIELEKELNTKEFKHHWVVDDVLYAKSKSLLFSGLYQWTGIKWEKAKIDIPVRNQAVLYSDEHFIVYRDCSGEFGGTVYFFDKLTEETYFTESTCANTVVKNDGKYRVLAHLGHMMGTSEIKVIDNPRLLSKATKSQITKRRKLGENLGYQDNTNALQKPLDLYGIQLFSTFKNRDRELFLIHLNQSTFIAEIAGSEIRIVNPLLNNDKYTHNPVTRTYGDYTLINHDFYGIALDREVSVMIIKDNKITMLDWNENHSR